LLEVPARLAKRVVLVKLLDQGTNVGLFMLGGGVRDTRGSGGGGGKGGTKRMMIVGEMSVWKMMMSEGRDG